MEYQDVHVVKNMEHITDLKSQIRRLELNAQDNGMSVNTSKCDINMDQRSNEHNLSPGVKNKPNVPVKPKILPKKSDLKPKPPEKPPVMKEKPVILKPKPALKNKPDVTKVGHLNRPDSSPVCIEFNPFSSSMKLSIFSVDDKPDLLRDSIEDENQVIKRRHKDEDTDSAVSTDSNPASDKDIRTNSGTLRFRSKVRASLPPAPPPPCPFKRWQSSDLIPLQDDPLDDAKTYDDVIMVNGEEQGDSMVSAEGEEEEYYACGECKNEEDNSNFSSLPFDVNHAFGNELLRSALSDRIGSCPDLLRHDSTDDLQNLPSEDNSSDYYEQNQTWVPRVSNKHLLRSRTVDELSLSAADSSADEKGQVSHVWHKQHLKKVLRRKKKSERNTVVSGLPRPKFSLKKEHINRLSSHLSQIHTSLSVHRAQISDTLVDSFSRFIKKKAPDPETHVTAATINYHKQQEDGTNTDDDVWGSDFDDVDEPETHSTNNSHTSAPQLDDDDSEEDYIEPTVVENPVMASAPPTLPPRQDRPPPKNLPNQRKGSIIPQPPPESDEDDEDYVEPLQNPPEPKPQKPVKKALQTPGKKPKKKSQPQAPSLPARQKAPSPTSPVRKEPPSPKVEDDWPAEDEYCLPEHETGDTYEPVPGIDEPVKSPVLPDAARNIQAAAHRNRPLPPTPGQQDSMAPASPPVLQPHKRDAPISVNIKGRGVALIDGVNTLVIKETHRNLSPVKGVFKNAPNDSNKNDQDDNDDSTGSNIGRVAALTSKFDKERPPVAEKPPKKQVNGHIGAKTVKTPLHIPPHNVASNDAAPPPLPGSPRPGRLRANKGDGPRFPEPDANKNLGDPTKGERPLPPVPVDDVEESLYSYSWYFRDADRKEIKRKLETMAQDGLFVVRKSQQGGVNMPYSMALFFHQKVWNLHIRVRDDHKYALGTYKPNEGAFKSIPELVSYHQQESIVLAGPGGGKTLLKSSPSQ